MIPNDFPSLNFDLGETADQLRASVRGFTADEIAPLADEIDKSQRVPAPALAEARRPGPARHHGGGGVRRLGARLPRALHRHGGDQPRLGVGRPFLRRAFQPVRQPAPPQRLRRAEAQVPAQADLRRARRRARHVGAGRGLRRRVDEAQGREEGRPLRPQRHQVLDHQRTLRRRAGGLRQDRSDRRPARHHRLPDREGLQGLLHRAEARQARHARLRHRASWCSRTARCRPRTCWARSARASTC